MKWLTIPNILTIVRMLSTIPLVLAISSGFWKEAFGILAFAGITDVADGWIARKYQQTSPLGAVLDPLADKILLLGCYVACASRVHEMYVLPGWFVTIIFLRELVLVCSAAIITQWYRVTDIQPTVAGKLTNLVQVIFVLLLMISNCFKISLHEILLIGQTVVMLASSFSFLQYAFYAYQGFMSWRFAKYSSYR